MGQTCTKGSDVADVKEESSRKGGKGGKGNKENAKNGGKKSPRPEERPQKFTAVSQIEALQHTMSPSVQVVEQELLHPDFRQFTPIFPMGMAALSVVSCRNANLQSQILVGGQDRSVALLNYETGHVLRRWVCAHENDINCITPPLASGVFATGSRDRVVKVWDVNKDDPVAELTGHTLNVPSVDIFAEGHYVVSGSKDNTVRLWDVETATELFCGNIKQNVVHFVRHVSSMNCVAQGGEDLTVRLWDVRTEGAKTDLSLSATIDEMDYYPVCCDLIPGKEYGLLTGHNGVNDVGSFIAEWDIRMCRRVRTYYGHKGTVNCVFASNSEDMYGLETFFSASEDGTIGIWPLLAEDAAEEVDQTVQHQFRVPEGKITSCECETNGDIVASLSQGCLVVFRPVMRNETVMPTQRYRYVGNMKNPTETPA